MRRADSFSIKVNNWSLMKSNLEPRLDQLPAQARPLQEELSVVVVEARQLEDEQENARKQFRELVRRRQELERRGEEARQRLAALLRGTFGFKSEELIPFGLNPQPRNLAARRRKKKEQADESGKTGKPTEPAAS
jgi:predicted nuclease with TOPRIM domain